jgi:hypothetical protein
MGLNNQLLRDRSNTKTYSASPDQTTPTELRRVTRGMNILLFIAAGLVFAAGFQLFILTEATDKYFSWTITPFLTAAFLGASYWASCVIELLATRERYWVNARMAVSAVLIFTTLTLIATLIHIDKFHFGDKFEPYTQFATWAWLAVYAIVPVVMTILLIQQLRAPGTDNAPKIIMPGWFQLLVGAQALVMVGVGLLFFVSPENFRSLWAWTLTPLTARAVGAWLLGLGVAAAQVALENDFRRSRVVLISCIAFGIFQVIALGRYIGTVNFGDARLWVYLVMLASITFSGVYGTLTLWRKTQNQ